MKTPAATWTPASHCPAADLTLTWGQLHGDVLGWTIADATGPIAATAGYPDSGPPVYVDAALAWAATVVGPRDWTQQPPQSGAFHTHPAGVACPGTP